MQLHQQAATTTQLNHHLHEQLHQQAATTTQLNHHLHEQLHQQAATHTVHKQRPRET